MGGFFFSLPQFGFHKHIFMSAEVEREKKKKV